jgi:hypothetical protein
LKLKKILETLKETGETQGTKLFELSNQLLRVNGIIRKSFQKKYDEAVSGKLTQ